MKIIFIFYNNAHTVCSSYTNTIKTIFVYEEDLVQMGTQQSKQDNKQTFSKQSSVRKSKSIPEREIITQSSAAIEEIRGQIKKFNGERNDDQYEQFLIKLTNYSKSAQATKNSLKNKGAQIACGKLIASIQECFKILEERVNQHESNLDHAAVESNSFISTPVGKMGKKQRSVLIATREPIKSLHEIDVRVKKVELDTEKAVDLEDTKQFVMLEKQIEILCTDLYLIKVEPFTPLHERKDEIERKLIKCNNRIKRCRRTLDRRSKTASSIQSEIKSDLRQEIYEQVAVKKTTETNENPVPKLIDTYMNENYEKMKVTRELDQVEKTVENLWKEVDKFEGQKGDESYNNLDQRVRILWAKLNDISAESHALVEKRKGLINEIQNLLRYLTERAQANKIDPCGTIYENKEFVKNNLTVKSDSQDGKIVKPPKPTPREESISPLQVYKQIDEFGIQWNRLDYNLGRMSQINVGEYVQKLQRLASMIKLRVDSLQKINFVDEWFAKKSDYEKPDILSNEVALVKPKLYMTTSFSQVQKTHNDIKQVLREIQQHNGEMSASEADIFKSRLNEQEMLLRNIEARSNDTVKNTKVKAMRTMRDAEKLLEEKKTIKKSFSIKALQQILNIDAEVSTLKQQIQNAPVQQIDNALISNLKKLEQIDDGGSENIKATKQNVVEEIEQCRNILSEKIKPDSGKEILKTVIDQLKKLKAQAEHFNGPYKSIHYKVIENDLLECSKRLDRVDSDRLQQVKNQTKDKIVQYLKILEERSSKPQQIMQETPERPNVNQQINTVREQLTSVKNAMEKFNGGYKDPEYIKLENDVLKCRHDLSSIADGSRNSIIATKVQYFDYIEKLLKYFEDKVSANHLTHQTWDNSLAEIQLIKENAEEMFPKVNNFSGSIDSLPYIDLNEKLIRLILRLDDISVNQDTNVREERRKVINLVQSYLQALEARASTNEVQSRKIVPDPFVEIKKIETQIRELQPAIEHFVGSRDDQNYIVLDETLIKSIVKLDNVQCGNNSTIRRERKKLIQLIQSYMKTLEKRTDKDTKKTKQLEEIDYVRAEMRQLASAVHNFSGAKNDDNYKYLDESMIQLIVKLDNIELNGDEEVRSKKREVIKEIQDNMKLLLEKSQHYETYLQNGNLRGTEV